MIYLRKDIILRKVDENQRIDTEKNMPKAIIIPFNQPMLCKEEVELIRKFRSLEEEHRGCFVALLNAAIDIEGSTRKSRFLNDSNRSFIE